MKILLIGNYAPDAQYSMQGYGRAVYQGLLARGHAVQYLAPEALFARYARGPLIKWASYLDKYLRFPPTLRRTVRTADVVHVLDQGNGMYVPHLRALGVPHLVTTHDLLAIRAARGELPGVGVSRTGRLYQNLIYRGLNQAQRLVCISQNTQREAQRLLPSVPAERISHAYLGLLRPVDAPAPSESAQRLQALKISSEIPFLLHVGGNQFYKNRTGLLRLYAALRRCMPDAPHLVLAGKPLPAALHAFISEQGLTPFVHERSGVSDDELNTLYARAIALVFPSLYEGFGLPILEAMACGCPVFTTNRAPMTEVGGTAAAYLPPNDPEVGATLLAEALAQPERLAQMRERGFSQAQVFDMDCTIDEYLRLYEIAIAEASTRRRASLPSPNDLASARTSGLKITRTRRPS